ncbi:MAG: prephenate dehydrogenase/arogenate dehydrogenase family protein, partial [Gemmatimonadaceae bacterium]|nr:prephenate dehydrogenase/arogenate dehydrogenase family protein [Chitinophagaceae bacterium]
MEGKRVAIIGVGLIGGSFALQLREKQIASTITGVESNVGYAEKALEMGLVDEIAGLEDAIGNADLIVMAVPVDVLNILLPKVLDKIDRQVVMDMGSTKSQLIAIVKDHPNRGRYVATHPMWGTEYSGPQAAVKGAFENKAVIICNASESD